MPAKKLKTSNTAQPNVVEKATNVVKKATPKKPKPTIKSLQEEAANLIAQLALKSVLIDRLEFDILRGKDDNKALEREITMLNASISHRDKIINKLETPWYKKALSLFGN